MDIWQKYISKKIDVFKNNEEFITLCKTLDEFYPERWDYSVTFPEKFDFYTFNKKHYYRAFFRDELDYYFRYKTSISNFIKENIKLEVVIYYPNIEISNRDYLKHKIEDLYVKVVFPIYNPMQLVELKGMRATITKNEFDKRYSHSHLPRGGYQDFSKFCLGSSEMRGYFQKEFITKDKTKIYQFLFTLENYLEYESIEGTPHIRMEDCLNLSDLKKVSLNDAAFKTLVKHKPPLKINTELKIINKEEIEEFYVDKCTLFSTKLNGKYYSLLSKSENNEINSLQDAPLFLFRNNLIKFKITNYATITEPKKYPHPTITKRIIEYWENRILQASIRSNRVKTENSIICTTESNESNQLSL